MDVHGATLGRPMIQERLKRFFNRTIVLLLLFAIPGLATLAKDSWYLPQADTGHYLTAQVKMNVVHSSVVLDQEPPQTVAAILPIKHQATVNPRRETETPVTWIRLTVSLQHRSPPTSLA